MSVAACVKVAQMLTLCALTNRLERLTEASSVRARASRPSELSFFDRASWSSVPSVPFAHCGADGFCLNPPSACAQGEIGGGEWA